MAFYGFGAATLLLPVCLLSMCAFQSVGQVIIEAPKNVTILLGRDGNFTCVTLDGTTHWRANDTNLPSDLYADLVTNSISLTGHDIFTLTVPGRAEHDGLRVQCVTEGGGDSAGSSIATLEIQGRLSSVGNLTIERNASWIILSWTAPPSLDVTNVDPDIWYSLIIFNVTNEDNPTIVPCNDCINITETYYAFTTEHPSPCHKYNFTVITYNGVGQGERNMTITAAFLSADDTKECNFQGSDVTVPEYTVPSTNKSDEETGRNLTPLWVVIAGALVVLGVALHVAGGTVAIYCHRKKAKQYASFNANLNANGGVNCNQSKMVTTQQQEAQPLLKVGNAVDEQKVESDSTMESAADNPEGLTEKKVVFPPVWDRKDPEQCTTIHTSTSANDTSKTFKKLDANVMTEKDCTSPASSLSPHEQSNSDLHQIADSPVVTHDEEPRQQTKQVTLPNKAVRPGPERSHTRETDGHGSLAEENGMDQVYKDEKTSQDGTSSPVPPPPFNCQKEPAEEVGSLDEVKMEMSSFAQSSVQEPAEKVGSPNEVKIEMSSFAQPSVQASGSHTYDPLHTTTATSPGEFPPDDDGGKLLPALPRREHTAITVDDAMTENAPHRPDPPANHSGSMVEVRPVTDASPLPKSQSMPCI